MLAAEVEVEDVASKVKVDGQFVSDVTLATAASLAIKLTDKYTQPRLMARCLLILKFEQTRKQQQFQPRLMLMVC